MKKSFFSKLLTLLMIIGGLSLLPQTAKADTGTTTLYFCVKEGVGNFYTSSSCDTVFNSWTNNADKWSWDSANQVLTLNNFEWITSNRIALFIVNDTEINLVGQNTIKSTKNTTSGYSAGITLNTNTAVSSNLIIGGTGSLAVTSGIGGTGNVNSFGIWVQNDRTITIKDSAKLTATAKATTDHNYAVGIGGHGAILKVQDEAFVTAVAEEAAATGSYGMEGGTITIDGGVLEVKGIHRAFNLVSDTATSFTVTDGTLTATATNDTPFSMTPDLPATYHYWTNTTTADPGGPGEQGPTADATWSATGTRFIKISNQLIYRAQQVGGVNGTTDSTGILVTFNQDVSGLTNSQIAVTGATANTVTDNGDSDGATWFIPLTDITVANGENITVAVADWISGTNNYDIVDNTAKNVVVYRQVESRTLYFCADGNFYNNSDCQTSPYTKGKGTTWTWDALNQVLTLNNFNWTTTNHLAMIFLQNTKINLQGTNSVISTAPSVANMFSRGISCDGCDLTLVGTGSLSVDSGLGSGGYSSWGILASRLTVSDSVNLTARANGNQSSAAGITAYLTINDQAQVTARAETCPYGDGVSGGNVTLNGGTLNVYGLKNGSAASNLTINGGTLIAQGGAKALLVLTEAPTAYYYAANTVMSDPGTTQTAPPAPSPALTDASYKYVKIIGRTALTYTAEQVGGTSDTADSTGILLTFNQPVVGLTNTQITVTGATAGTLTDNDDSNETTWFIPLSDITVANGENVTVAVADWTSSTNDYDVLDNSATNVAVYKAEKRTLYFCADGAFYTNSDCQTNPYTKGKGTTWSWDAPNQVLTLNNFNWTTSAFQALVFASGTSDTTVNLVGANSITSTYSGTEHTIATIQGPSVLTITSANSGTLAVTSGQTNNHISHGYLNSSGTLTIAGSAQVTVNTTMTTRIPRYSVAVTAGTTKLEDSAKLTVQANAATVNNSYGVDGNLILNGGTLDASGYTAGVNTYGTQKITFNKGLLIAKCLKADCKPISFTAISTPQLNLPAIHTYWVNTTDQTKPAGAGTAVPSNPSTQLFNIPAKYIEIDGSEVQVDYDVVQTGGVDDLSTTTGLTLTFDKMIAGLTAAQITLTGATAGTPTTTDYLTWQVPLSNITVADGENITVAVADWSNIDVTDNTAQSVKVYKITNVDLTYDAVQVGGISGKANSTGILLTFSQEIASISASQITVTGATADKPTDNDDNDKTTWLIPLSDIKVGNGENITIAIDDWTYEANFYDVADNTAQDVIVYTLAENGNGSNSNNNTSKSATKKSALSIPSPWTCTDQIPHGTIDLFQIDRIGSIAKIYFSPINGWVQNYHVVYGHEVGNEQFALLSAGVTEVSNNGVQVMEISDLDPTLNYAFQVMPVNGCAVGERSNWLTTTGAKKSNSNVLRSFYRY